MQKVLLLSVLLLGGLLHSGEPRTITAEKADGPIRLDGRITESAWAKVAWQDKFRRLDGKPAVEPTRFKVLAGREGLFFAFNVTDSNIKSQHKDHDGPLWGDDCIEIFILSEPEAPADPNIREYRHFIFTPGGTRYEQLVRGGVGNVKWNVPWKAAVVKTPAGYDAEVFIPYYALNPVKGINTWRINIGRENKQPGELSLWNPAKRFDDTENFGILKAIPVDFSAYSASFNVSEIGMKAAGGKVLPQVKGVLNGNDKTSYTVQISVRGPNGKLAAFNSAEASPLQGKAEISIPLEIAESGKYLFAFTVNDPTGRIISYEEKKLAVSIAAFEAKMLKPHYRDNIYLALPDPQVLLAVDLFVPEPERKKAVLSVVIQDSKGRKAAGKSIQHPAKNEKIKFDASGFAPGSYRIKTTLSGSGRYDGEVSSDFQVVAKPSKGNLITLDSEKRVIINGKPFFPRDFFGYGILPELQKSGFNILIISTLHRSDIAKILQRLDTAHKQGIMLAFSPRHKIPGDFFGFKENGKTVKTLSAASYEKMAKMVNAVKSHPAFFGWYLYDEPRGAEIVAELKRQYEFLRKIDPDHPVIGGDNTAGACIAKTGCCDIHLLDLYYCPHFNGKAEKPMFSLFASTQNIYDSCRQEAVWFMPQAFNHGSFFKKQDYPSPTYAETRCMVFGTIAAGASGMVPYKLGQPNVKYYEKHANSGIFFSPEMKLGWLEGIGPEIKNLAPVLVAEKIKIKCSSEKLRVAGKKLNGKHFLIAVNPYPENAKAEIIWSDGNIRSLRVLGEKRTIPVKNGRFTAEFSPYMVHIFTDDANYPEGVDIAAVTARIAGEIKAERPK